MSAVVGHNQIVAGNVLMCIISGILIISSPKSVALMSRTWTTTASTANQFSTIDKAYMDRIGVMTTDFDNLKTKVFGLAGCDIPIVSVAPTRWGTFNQSPLCSCLSVQHEIYMTSIHQHGAQHTLIAAGKLREQCLWKVRGTQVSYMEDSVAAHTVNPLALFQLWCTMATVCAAVILRDWTVQETSTFALYIVAMLVPLLFMVPLFWSAGVYSSLGVFLTALGYICLCNVLTYYKEGIKTTHALIFWSFFAAALTILVLLYNYYAQNRSWLYNAALIPLCMGIALVMFSCECMYDLIESATGEAKTLLTSVHTTAWGYTMATLVFIYSCSSMPLDSVYNPTTASALGVVIPFWGVLFIMQNQAISAKIGKNRDVYRLLVDLIARVFVLVALTLDVVNHAVVENK